MSYLSDEESYVMELTPDEDLEEESYVYLTPEPVTAPIKVAAATKPRILYGANSYQGSSRADGLRTLAAPNKDIVKKITENITKREKRRSEIHKMLEIKKEFDKNTKEITSINSLRENIKKNENGTIQQLTTENKMIPDLRKQISILESHIDSLKEIQKLQNINGSKEEVSAKSAVLSVKTSSAKSRIMSATPVSTTRTNRNKSIGVTGLKTSAKSRIGIRPFGRGGGVSKSSISTRLGNNNRTMKERTQTPWEDECQEENNFDFETMEEEELDDVELEREYLGLRCSDTEQDKDEEFQPLPDDLVLTELTENGPKPAKRKRISAP